MNNTESAQISAAVRRMKAQGMSQRAIATALDISQSMVSRVLRKPESEDTPLLRFIAKANRLNELYGEISRASDAGDEKRAEALWNDVAAIKASMREKN